MAGPRIGGSGSTASPSVQRLIIGPSCSMSHQPLRDVGMIHRDLARLVAIAQHDALHPHAEPALIAQPGARLGRRLRARNQPDLGCATRQHEDDPIAVAEDRFDGAPIGDKPQVGIRRGARPAPAGDGPARSARRCHTGRTFASSHTNGAQEPASRVGWSGLVGQVRMQHQRRARVGEEPAVAGVEIAFRRQSLGQQDGVSFSSTW